MAADEEQVKKWLAEGEGLVLRTIEVVQVNTGDTLILTTDERWSDAQTAKAGATLKLYFPGINILVLTKASLEVVRDPEGVPLKDITLSCGCWLVVKGNLGDRTVPDSKACLEHDGADAGALIFAACQAGLLEHP